MAAYIIMGNERNFPFKADISNIKLLLQGLYKMVKAIFQLIWAL